MALNGRDKAAVTRWLETQRGRKQFRHAPAAGEAMSRIIRPMAKKYKSGSSARQLIPHWEQIVGMRWARISRPVKFIGQRGSRTLVISAPGAASGLITAASTQIINRLTPFLGAGYVQRLKVVPDMRRTDTHPAPPPKRGLSPREHTALQSLVETVDNNALKQALKDLGEKIITRPQ